jgi:hypothetical protein
MRLTCPRCGRTIPGADVDMRAGASGCQRCSDVVTVLPGADLAPAKRDAPYRAAQVEKGPLAEPNVARVPARARRPNDLRWTETGSATGVNVTVTDPCWPWRVVRSFFAVLLAAMAVCFPPSLIHGRRPGGPIGGALLMLVIVSGLLAFSGYTIYLALVGLNNHTRITLDRDRLQIVRAPIRERGGLLVATSDVEGFVMEVLDMSEGYPRHVGAAGTLARHRYALRVQTRDGLSRKTHLTFRDREHAEYAVGRMAQLIRTLGDAKCQSQLHAMNSTAKRGKGSP